MASRKKAVVVDPVALEEAAEMEQEEEEEEQEGGKRMRGAGGAAVAKPEFEAVSAQEVTGGKMQYRKIPVPPHRYTPLRKDWMQIYTPIVEHLKLDVRMNPRNRCIELKTSEHTEDVDLLQKAADFIRAYLLGFAIGDAVALLRVEDLYVDTFMVRLSPRHPPSRPLPTRPATGEVMHHFFPHMIDHDSTLRA